MPASRCSTFIANSPNNFHYFKACELMGDLCVALGKFADAQKYYAKLSQAPWPDYKIRAQVALGRSYLAQGNAAAADKAFDDALDNDAPGELAEIQRTAARIGKARCMVLAGKTDQALRSLNEILDRADEKTPPRSTPWPTTPWARPCARPASPRKRFSPSCTSICSTPRCPTSMPRRSPTSRDCSPRPISRVTPRHAGDPRRQVQEQPLGQRRQVAMGQENLLAWLAHSLGAPFAVIFLFLSVALVALMVVNVLAVRRDSVVPPALIQGLEVRLGEDRFQEACDLVRADHPCWPACWPPGCRNWPPATRKRRPRWRSSGRWKASRCTPGWATSG